MTDAPGRDGAAALAALRAGRLDEAEALYARLVVLAPDDVDLLGLYAVVKEQTGAVAQAEALYRRATVGAGPAEVVLRNTNNYLGFLLDTNRRDEALALVDGGIPEWPTGLAANEAQIRTVTSLLVALSTLDRPKLASRLADSFVTAGAGDVEFLGHYISLLLDENRLATALELCEAASAGAGSDPDLTIVCAAALSAAGKDGPAAQAMARAAASAPLLVAPAQPGQTMTLLVLNTAAPADKGIRTQAGLHLYCNYPAQMAQLLPERYRFISVIADIPEGLESLRHAPRPDVVVNNCVNAERISTPGLVDVISAVADRPGVPVVNHPRAVLNATRQRNSERLAKIPGVIAPAMARYVNAGNHDELIADIETSFFYPVIVRTVFGQMGSGATFVTGRAQLLATLENTVGQQVYVLQYIDCRRGEGFHRKMRFGVAGSESMMLRVDHCDYWSIIGRRQSQVLDFYERRPDMARLSNEMALHPENFFEPAVFDKLRRVAEAVPLDIFGIDFDVTAAGDIVVFEANASMNLIAPKIPTLNYPKEPEDRMIAAIDRVFRQKAGMAGAG